MQADLCFDPATEGATGGLLSSPPVVAAKRRPRSTSTVVERGQENYKGQGPEGHRPDYLCSFFGAAAAGDGLYDLSLFAGTGVLDKVPDVDDAIVAGVGALQASVVRLYGVVVILGAWVRVVRYSHGVNLLVRLAGSRGVRGFCGTISFPTTSLYDICKTSASVFGGIYTPHVR